MIEVDGPKPVQIAQMSMEGLNRIVAMLQELPWKMAQPIMNEITQHARVVTRPDPSIDVRAPPAAAQEAVDVAIPTEEVAQ